MKTLNDLINMTNIKCQPFENQYNYLFLRLEDYYISKSDGINRIKAELSNWDDEAQNYIINNLINMLVNENYDLDVEDLQDLLKD